MIHDLASRTFTRRRWQLKHSNSVHRGSTVCTMSPQPEERQKKNVNMENIPWLLLDNILLQLRTRGSTGSDLLAPTFQET